jgi:hypothetical protein
MVILVWSIGVLLNVRQFFRGTLSTKRFVAFWKPAEAFYCVHVTLLVLMHGFPEGVVGVRAQHPLQAFHALLLVQQRLAVLVREQAEQFLVLGEGVEVDVDPHFGEDEHPGVVLETVPAPPVDVAAQLVHQHDVRDEGRLVQQPVEVFSVLRLLQNVSKICPDFFVKVSTFHEPFVHICTSIRRKPIRIYFFCNGVHVFFLPQR